MTCARRRLKQVPCNLTSSRSIRTMTSRPSLISCQHIWIQLFRVILAAKWSHPHHHLANGTRWPLTQSTNATVAAWRYLVPNPTIRCFPRCAFTHSLLFLRSTQPGFSRCFIATKRRYRPYRLHQSHFCLHSAHLTLGPGLQRPR